MSKELNYIADLERENRTIKSILYCTKRSCNNCGKVNCENFQRQRIDCCGLWVSYKDYIKELERVIAELKKENEELPTIAFQQGAEWYKKKADIKLTKAKEIIKKIEKIFYSGENALKRLSKISDILADAEQFLKESE